VAERKEAIVFGLVVCSPVVNGQWPVVGWLFGFMVLVGEVVAGF